MAVRQKFTGKDVALSENLLVAIIVLSIINNKQSQWDERHYFFVYWIQKICSLYVKCLREFSSQFWQYGNLVTWRRLEVGFNRTTNIDIAATSR